MKASCSMLLVAFRCCRRKCYRWEIISSIKDSSSKMSFLFQMRKDFVRIMCFKNTPVALDSCFVGRDADDVMWRSFTVCRFGLWQVPPSTLKTYLYIGPTMCLARHFHTHPVWLLGCQSLTTLPLARQTDVTLYPGNAVASLVMTAAWTQDEVSLQKLLLAHRDGWRVEWCLRKTCCFSANCGPIGICRRFDFIAYPQENNTIKMCWSSPEIPDAEKCFAEKIQGAGFLLLVVLVL